MSKKLVTIERIIDYFKKNQNQKITAGQLANLFYNNFPDEAQAKSEIWDGSMKELISQISGEISSRILTIQSREELNIKTEDIPKNNTNREEYGNSRQFYIYYGEEEYKKNVEDSGQEIPIKVKKKNDNPEERLYPVLWQFLKDELNVFSKRIDEKRSSNSYGPSGNDWLHPDMVGIEDLGAGWHREIKDFAEKYAKGKLWSFEVKTTLKNVRKYFFQAVSNSSWANFGYLVALPIRDEKVKRELRMLSALHGIGFIELNEENPRGSQIVIPARERTAIDWASVNRLANENPDFLEYVKLVRSFYNSADDIKEYEWKKPEVTKN